MTNPSGLITICKIAIVALTIGVFLVIAVSMGKTLEPIVQYEQQIGGVAFMPDPEYTQNIKTKAIHSILLILFFVNGVTGCVGAITEYKVLLWVSGSVVTFLWILRLVLVSQDFFYYHQDSETVALVFHPILAIALFLLAFIIEFRKQQRYKYEKDDIDF